jgi:hypothetical protein
MKTSHPMKKGNDKWAEPYLIMEVYPWACHVQLPDCIRIFPVFHNYLLQRKNPEDVGLPSQAAINEIELRYIRGRILEREDGKVKLVKKKEFKELLNCHNEDGLHYLIK